MKQAAKQDPEDLAKRTCDRSEWGGHERAGDKADAVHAHIQMPRARGLAEQMV